MLAARMGSSRLPGKAMKPLGGIPMLAFQMQRLRGCSKVDEFILATTTLPEDDVLKAVGEQYGFKVFRGANEDVVKRFVEAAEDSALDYVVRVTGDCPFTDNETLQYCLLACENMVDFDLASTKGQFPVGIDYEIYKRSSMEKLHYYENLSADEREHLTLYMYKYQEKYLVKSIAPSALWPRGTKEFTVDTLEDYQQAQVCVAKLGCNNFTVEALLEVACNAH